jgi:transforming growth factor-beta-induced protein
MNKNKNKKKCVSMIAMALALSLMAGLVCVNAAEPTPPEGKKAITPSPKDGATDVLRNGTVLSWSPGQTTPKYDVYFGSIRKYVEQVDRAAPVYVQASIGQKTTTYTPGPLELGKTYYWRVDEVDDADPTAVKVVKGDIWSFMVETPVLPVGNITATASCSIYENMGPQKTVDGSGLTGDLHSADMTQMWLSCFSPPDPNDPNNKKEANWIQYEFDKVQRLQDMQIWNWNSGAEKYFGLGVKDATVKYSSNGTDWTALGDVKLARAPGTADYKYNAVVNFNGKAAKFVKIVIKSSQNGYSEYGLSEVRFFAVPVQAREPSPAVGTTGVALDPSLNWRTGREAVSHKVYISADKQAVIKGTAQVYTVNTNSLKLASLSLDLDKTYYWKVSEVNDAASPKSFDGDVWSFSTVDTLVLDNFESYTTNLGSTWGTSVYGSSLAIDKSVVHAGTQSMVISYKNTSNVPSWTQTTRAISSPQNWTKNGIKKLVVFLRGDTTVPIGLRINGVDLTYNGGAQGPWWGCWSIDLASKGSGFTSVGSISLTFGIPANRSGTVYVDDIRLSSKLPSPGIVDQVMILNGTGATKGQFDTLAAALFAADATIFDTLSGEQTYTLFAPTDDAFTAAKISEKTDKAVLSDILRFHIAASKLSVTNKGTVKTLEGSTLIQDANVVTDEIGGKAVIAAGADASNGTILSSNAVLMPFQMVNLTDLLKALNAAGDYKGKFDTLLAALDAAKQTVRDTLNKRFTTLFAPTNDAFAALGYDKTTIKTVDQAVLSDILLYQMASGRIMGKDLIDKITTLQGGVLNQSKGVLTDTLGGTAKIVGLDVEGTNGVIHITDAVGMPFAKTRLLNLVALVNSLNKSGDLAGKFSTLIAVADKADSAKVAPLLSAGAYTLFAPTDAGFAKVGIDAAAVKSQTKAFLTDLLLYHITSGSVTAKAALAAKTIKTLQGGALVTDPNGTVLIDALKNQAKITTADVAASNGLVQVIDSGLLPYAIPAVVVPPTPEPVLVSLLDTVIALNMSGDRKGQFDTFLAAVDAAGPAVSQKLTGKDAYTVFVPTDDALATLGITPQSVVTTDKLVVTDILLYHMTAGKLMAADVLAAKSITMLKGGSVQQADGTLTDNTGGKAKIVGQDIKASNGVIHVINAVLLPAKP